MAHGVHRLLQLVNCFFQVADAVVDRAGFGPCDALLLRQFRYGGRAVARRLYGYSESGVAELQGVGPYGGGVGGERLYAERWIRRRVARFLDEVC